MFKKFSISFLCILLILLIGFGGLVYIVDPFNVYRADDDPTKIIYQNPYYQNIGIAKNTKYDTLITGTSMTQNFRGWWFDEKFGCKAIRLSFDGGIVSDFDALIKTAVENNEKLKTVYFGLDNYLITADSKLNDISERIPEYMLSDNPFLKVKYLLNKDVIFDYMLTYFAYKNSDSYDFYEMHAWDTMNPVFSKETVINNYKVPEQSKNLEDESFMSDCEDFLDAVGKYAECNPQIQFVFFAPPYSILYWHTLIKEGKLDATMHSLKYVYGELLECKNVRIFYFQNDFEKITNLENYKDATHYRTDYNKYMLDCFVNGNMELTKKNYTAVLDEMKEFALSYDYETLFKEKVK